MKIKSIALIAVCDDGILRPVKTSIVTGEKIIEIVKELEGEVKVMDIPLPGLKIQEDKNVK